MKYDAKAQRHHKPQVQAPQGRRDPLNGGKRRDAHRSVPAQPPEPPGGACALRTGLCAHNPLAADCAARPLRGAKLRSRASAELALRVRRSVVARRFVCPALLARGRTVPSRHWCLQRCACAETAAPRFQRTRAAPGTKIGVTAVFSLEWSHVALESAAEVVVMTITWL